MLFHLVNVVFLEYLRIGTYIRVYIDRPLPHTFFATLPGWLDFLGQSWFLGKPCLKQPCLKAIQKRNPFKT